MSNYEIPVVEIFGEPGSYAIQGEGYYAGVPSVFVRTFGCNLKCRFGLAEDPMMAESYEKQIRNYPNHFPKKTLDELPVFDHFCDTYYSIFPEYRKYTNKFSVENMFEELKKRTDNFNSNIHIVITGGEPLLPKYQLFWNGVLNMIDYYVSNHLVNITFETNGTYKLITHFPDDTVNVNYSISPKLKNSGHTYFETIKPEAVKSYVSDTSGICWFKFVGKDESIVKEIKDVIELYNLSYLPVFIMPEGGTKKEFDKNAGIIYDVCSKYGYRYSPRHQVSVKNNGIGI